MTTTFNQIVSEDLRRLQAQLAALAAQRVEIEQAEKDLKARIATITGKLRGTLDLGNGQGLVFSYRRQFNAELAAEVLGSSEVYPSICRTVPDAKLAKAVLPPAVYEMCQVESDTPSIAPTVIK